MTYLKYIQYFYLFAAAFFAYLGFTSLNQEDSERNPWLMFFFAALAIFMFLFRRKFYKKYQNKK